MTASKPKLLRITTVPISLKLLLEGQVIFFQDQGFDVLAVSAGGNEVAEFNAMGIPHRVVSMTRKITPVQDVRCIVALIKIIRQFEPDIVHTHTPKAGLLGMLAAWWCRVPVRMHTVAGLPVMEARGVKRRILIWTELITYRCATHVFPNSKGLLEFIRLAIYRGSWKNNTKFSIIGNGSSNGIDVDFFKRTEALEYEASQLREGHGIGKKDILFSFVGRIVKDKGIRELVSAFRKLTQTKTDGNVFLVLVGPFEQDLDPLAPADLEFLNSHPRVILAGFQKDVRPWIQASDAFVFPSYREGFPNVVMQACCLEVACIVSDINGCNEIIQHRKNGLVVTVKDSEMLFQAMHELIQDPSERRRLADAARPHVVANFSRRFVWHEILKRYRQGLSGR